MDARKRLRTACRRINDVLPESNIPWARTEASLVGDIRDAAILADSAGMILTDVASRLNNSATAHD